MKLDNVLCGMQRVPTLLLLNPQQPLGWLDLDRYTMLDCEPLHDIQGHFSHLLKELPFLLGSADRAAVEIIKATASHTMTGAKYSCMIEVLIHLRKQSVSKEVIMLVVTAIQMSIYCTCPKPKGTHATSFSSTELSCMFITKKMTAVTFFSRWRSYHCNLWTRRTKRASLNRHKGQLRQPVIDIHRMCFLPPFWDSRHRQHSRNQPMHSNLPIVVSKASASAPKYSGTETSKSFHSSWLSSWQAHLKRLAHYFAPSKGVCWEKKLINLSLLWWVRPHWISARTTSSFPFNHNGGCHSPCWGVVGADPPRADSNSHH